MPLTPAHAAAVIPLQRWKSYFWLSPLVVGSMAPDFIYYVFPKESWRHVGHTPLGLVDFCIPAGLLVLYVFHRLVKRPLVMLMPRPLRDKLWPQCGLYLFLPLRRLIWICTLVLLGAVTHVVWDGLTHEDGWALSNFPQMDTVLFTIAGQQLHVCGLLQYGSSLLGLALLACWSWQWQLTAPVGRSPAESPEFRWARPAIVTAMLSWGMSVGVICGLRYACRLAGPFSAHEFLEAAFITGADAFGLAFAVYVATAHFRGWWKADSFSLLRDGKQPAGRSPARKLRQQNPARTAR